ncbi:hypothetical protein NA57DRAFT_52080 [Rhizodiscina lignyota]|uniref:Uncharacterized protein n=1 Tax=Rhizodiscina lignyota TaxID=1504668 RepID=A0A9P4IQ65_9PEZI|nr:hypothetical protein NA57DRAFT_52080 [Rhizodiscina lignyota]
MCKQAVYIHRCCHIEVAGQDGLDRCTESVEEGVRCNQSTRGWLQFKLTEGLIYCDNCCAAADAENEPGPLWKQELLVDRMDCAVREGTNEAQTEICRWTSAHRSMICRERRHLLEAFDRAKVWEEKGIDENGDDCGVQTLWWGWWGKDWFRDVAFRAGVEVFESTRHVREEEERNQPQQQGPWRSSYGFEEED